MGSAYSRARTGGTALSAPRLSVGAELTLEGTCQVNGGMDLSMSELSSFSVGPGCSLRAPGRTALDLTNAELLSTLTLGSDVTVEGTTRLTGARIHGRLTLSGAILSEPEGRTLIAAQGAVVEGGADLQDLHATGGRLRFSNSTLGSVVAVGAQLVNPGGFTLSLHQATVKGSVVLVDGFKSEGLLDLSRSTIEGRLECDGGSFTCPGPAERNEHGHAIEAISATIRGGIYMASASISPGVDFTNAATTFLGGRPRQLAAPLRHLRVHLRPLRPAPGQQHKPGLGPRRTLRLAQPAGRLRRRALRAGRPRIPPARIHQRSKSNPDRPAQARTPGHHRPLGAAAPCLDAAYSITVSYGYRPGRVLWLLAILLILVTGSLLMPGAQAAMRATSAGTVYTTQGPLRARAAAATTAPRTATPRQHRRRLRQRPGPVLQPAPVRHRHRHPARITRSKIDMAPRCPRPRRHLHAMVAQRRHRTGLAPVLHLRPVPGQPRPIHVT